MGAGGAVGVKHLLCFGFGFSAKTLAHQLDRDQWRVTGTSRSGEGAAAITAQGFAGVMFEELDQIPETVTHILSSVPPDDLGDPVLQKFENQLRSRATSFDWVGYLSTTGVYGDRAGGYVDEQSSLAANTARGARRVLAEASWMSIEDLPIHIFRLAGIYGPGRNALETIKSGRAQRVIKPGQIFSRIHVEDIAGVVLASIAQPDPERIYNLADDEACPPQDVITYAAELLGVEPPPEVAFEDAKLSAMAKSFYADSKRVSNARIRNELGYVLKYPNYRVGLKALL
jgi:nucleoside-diphosphate-sugar epimerase